MMLSLCRAMYEQSGENGLRQLSVTCVDLDGYCARMSGVQLLCNLYVHDLALGEVIVLRGNSLFPDSGMEVIVHANAKTFPAEELAPALHPKRLDAIRQAAVSSGVGTQLPIFPDTDEAA